MAAPTPDPTRMPDEAVESAEARAIIERRTFFKWMSAIGGTIAGAMATVPALSAFMSPAFQPVQKLSWVKIGEAALFDIGVPDRVDFAETGKDAWVTTRTVRSVWVYTEDGEHFTAYNGKCPHLGCAYGLDEHSGQFKCPCHNGVFDMKTGGVVAGPPPRGLDALQCKVEDGAVYVAYQDFQLGVAEKMET
ncbi:MAG TPA: ubiquinol-cytochrome c reductase iron-sulfur subunit [Longimicrobiales bacterium]|nr:ubiquinol-cytochrome c reductase iron-sulfur subunit [Longimicrobiales bacterium]